ncbi:4413_t:CDS:2, partial [Dentiscutata heterogama]
LAHNITDAQEIQNDESNNNFDIIEQLRGPDCFNHEIQQYTSIKAEYFQADNSLELNNIGPVTNLHIIAHRGQLKKLLQDSLDNTNRSNSQKTHKKVLHRSDVPNKPL